MARPDKPESPDFDGALFLPNVKTGWREDSASDWLCYGLCHDYGSSTDITFILTNSFVLTVHTNLVRCLRDDSSSISRTFLSEKCPPKMNETHTKSNFGMSTPSHYCIARSYPFCERLSRSYQRTQHGDFVFEKNVWTRRQQT